MENCNLSILPNEVGNLISLETLDLCYNKLHTLPDGICNLTRLKKLYLAECDVSHLPGEIGRLISLERLVLGQNNLLTLPDSFCNLASLGYLDLEDCNLSHLPDRIGMLSSLMELNLGRNNVCSLPKSFSDLASLEDVYLCNCKRLQSLPELPVSLRLMDASHCTLLESIPTEFNWQAGLDMSFEGCDMLAKNNFANNVLERIEQSLSEDKKDREWSEDSVLGENACIYLPGDDVPNWFQYQYTGSKLSLVVPPLETRRILGCSLCVVFRAHENRGCDDYPILTFHNKNKKSIFEILSITQDQDKVTLFYFPSKETELFGRIHAGDEFEIEIEQSPWLTVKKCGINLIYEVNTEMPSKKKRKITDTRDSDISSPRN
ncbi:hypothetical protein RHSIM_Rhsim13G0019700 [Rhododendron simsii]|uniref:Uncharacterized protein n=1 Tax=Rhododendron simsii TaxID=118357 RepID=A0A834G0Z4_RHOSS|nr:hypothetical protein RHSIM_Rhsim13G0019700 [Rhododendron simsii]